MAGLDFRWFFIGRRTELAFSSVFVSALSSILGKKSLGLSLESVRMWMNLQEIQMLSALVFL